MGLATHWESKFDSKIRNQGSPRSEFKLEVGTLVFATVQKRLHLNLTRLTKLDQRPDFCISRVGRAELTGRLQGGEVPTAVAAASERIIGIFMVCPDLY